MRLHSTVTDYEIERDAQLLLAENNGQDVILHAHVDSRHIATIGIGVNLRVHGYLVLQTLGFDVEGQTLTGAALTAEQNYINELFDAFQATYTPGVTTSNAAFTTFNDILERRANDIAYNGIDPPIFRASFFALAAGEEAALLHTLVDVGYQITRPAVLVQGRPLERRHTAFEATLDTWLTTAVNGVSIVDVVPELYARDNRERVALLSMHYGNPTTLPGDRLRNALIANDRAEAWYEIRYRSNPLGTADRSGMANRRYGEADIFGLYNENRDQHDFKAAYRMFTRHRNEVIYGVPGGLQGYEGVLPAGARGSEELELELEDASDFLLAPSLTHGITIEWDHIYVGENDGTDGGADTRWFRGGHASADSDPDLRGSSDNDLIFAESGDDNVYGGDGRDVIYGAAGNDTMTGGVGNDYLEGGAGNDIYHLNIGDGQDDIVDGSGNDLVVFDGTPVGVLVRDAGGSSYSSPGGRFVATVQGTALLVSDTQTGTTVLLADFVEGQFGIQLEELGPIPPQGTFAHITNIQSSPTLNVYEGTPAKETTTGSAIDDDIFGHGGGDYLLSGPGADRIEAGTDALAAVADAGAGRDVIVGTEGNDRLIGGPDADPGVDDDDAIQGGAGDDYIEGGWGDDVLAGGAGRDVVVGGAGHDLIHTAGTLTAIDRTWAIDRWPDPVGGVTTYIQFSGSYYDSDGVGDVAYGGTGLDFIIGGAGDDAFFGEEDNDTLVGNAGNDVLSGGAGVDSLDGGYGADRLFGGSEADHLFGEGFASTGGVAGNDYLDGGSGDDHLYGRGADDTLVGGDDNDELFGGAGADVLYGDAGADFLQGGDGSGGGDGADVLIGGTGADTLLGEEEDDLLVGGADNDQLGGGAGADVLEGGDGADVLDGGAGADVLEGGDGADVLDGGAGADILDGGRGADTIVHDPLDTIVWRSGDGQDVTSGTAPGGRLRIDDLSINGLTVSIAVDPQDWQYLVFTSGSDELAIQGGFLQATMIYEIGGETFTHQQLMTYAPAMSLFGTEGADTIYGSNNSDILHGYRTLATDPDGDDVFHGQAGDDQVDGGLGADDLYGDEGNDTLVGGSGNDTLVGGLGQDVLAGGEGDDRYVIQLADAQGDPSSADAIYDSVGSNILEFGAEVAFGDLFLTQFDTDFGDVAVRLFSDSSFYLVMADALKGGWDQFTFANDVTESARRFFGTRYLSTVDYSTSLDATSVFGGVQDDTITATGGDVTIAGGQGNDELIGGTGSTTYLFGRDDGQDSVSDSSTQSTTGAKNTLVLEDFALTDLTLLASGSSDLLTLRFAGTLDSIVTPEFEKAAVLNGARTFDELIFSNGVAMTWAQVVQARGIDILGTGVGSATLQGTSVDDRLTGSSANETLQGEGGNDVLDGGGGADTLVGGAGDDTYRFGLGSGADTIDNTDPSSLALDTLEFTGTLLPTDLQFFEVGDALIVAIEGSADTLTINDYFTTGAIDEIRFAADSTVYTPANVPLTAASSSATQSDDFLFGTPSGDVIDGLGGIDNIYGFGGNDALSASAGGGTIFGGGGNDTLNGGVHADVLFGGDDDDTIVGGDNADTLLGENGNDTLDGGYGADTLVGGAGTDTLSGGAHNDTLNGGDGADTLNGGAGNDILSGANDADALTDLEGVNQLFGESGNDVLVGRGTLEGGDGDDAMTGSDFADTLRGNADNDVLHGGGGMDSLYGGAGNDELHSGAGVVGTPELLYGEDGDDTLHAESAAVLRGGAGSDTYVVHLSALANGGSVTLLESDLGSIDTLRFGAGILPSNLRVRRSIDDASFSVVDPATGTWKVLLNALVVFSEWSIIDEVRFTDDPATVWDLDDLAAATAIGSPDDDGLSGTAGDDVLTGGAGNDVLFGSWGADDLDGGPGRDVLEGSNGDDTYRFGWGSGYDEIGFGAVGTDRIQFAAGVSTTDVTLIRTSTPRLFSGNETGVFDSLAIVLGNGADQILINGHYGVSPAIDAIHFDNGTIWDAAEISARAVNQAGTQNSQSGTSGNDVFFVDHSSDSVSDSSSADNDTVNASVSYSLHSSIENLVLTGSLALRGRAQFFASTVTGNAADNILEAYGTGIDTLIGGLGNDIYRLEASVAGLPAHVVIESANEGDDTLTLAGDWFASVTLPDHVERFVLSLFFANGTNAYTFTGNALDNVLDISRNARTGLTVDGGAGADLMIGGVGAQTYIVDNAGDAVVDHEGVDDWVHASVTYTLTTGVQNLLLTGSNAIDGTGNAGNNRLDGTLNTAANVLAGGAGDDWYVLGVNDSVVEAADGGIDTVELNFNYTLGQHVENVRLTAGGAVTVTGNAGNNHFDSGDNASASVFIGGAGDDTYILANQVTAVENAGEGYDTVIAYHTYTLPEHIEYAIQMGGLGLTGNDNDNVLFGYYSNSLVGLGGNDTLIARNGTEMRGGAGADTYRLLGPWMGSASVIQDTASGSLQDSSVDVLEMFDYDESELAPELSQLFFARAANHLDLQIGTNFPMLTLQNFFAPGAAQDRIELFRFRDGTTYTADEIVELMTVRGTEGADTLNALASGSDLLGQGGNDTLNGAAGNDLLDGGSGADTMAGGGGNDLYRVDDAGDVLIEAANQGVDTVEAGVSYSLLSNLENVTLTGTGDFNATGNNEANTFRGNSGANVFTGGPGNDTYYIDSLSDSIVELSGQGLDTVFASGIDYTLANEVENLTLLAGALNGTGNGLSNYIVGNASNNVIDGAGGFDFLEGGAGDDTYIGDATLDEIYENVGGGIDTVMASVNWVTLASNVENITLVGAAISATGNSLNNVIIGNANNNTLNGGSGSGADTLDGGAGADSMTGGSGNDTYYVDNSGDTVTESSGGGTLDIAYSTATSWTMGNNVEQLFLLGTGNINGTGNGSANVITGNAGNNALNGGSGADTLIGGAGNDTYTVDNAGDVVTENAGEGTDSVSSSVTYTISDADVENLTLTGSSGLSATGNSSDNTLTGNSGANTLTGLGGNDWLDGGTGTDTMVGGQGDDTYVVNTTGETVTELANEGTDLVRSAVTYTLGNHVENLLLTGTTVNGTGNALDNVLTGSASNNTLTGNDGHDTLNGMGGSDTMVGGLGNDIYYVDVSGDVTTEQANQGIDTINSSMTRTLVANIELLFLTGSSAINGTGSSVANIVRGNSGVNTLQGAGGTDILEGGAGNDILQNTTGTPGKTLLNGGADTDTLTGTANNDLLIGGLGNDALTTGQGADIIVFNQGEGQDTVASSTTKDNVLSLGGGILYADLLFQKSGNNLILKAGGTDQITFTNYYSSTSNRSVDKLQIVIEGTSDYDSGSGDALRNKKIATFNFDGLVAAFDAALVANPGLTTWALTNALVAQHLGGSDTAAIGGDLAYRYGRFDTLSDISFTPAGALLAAAGFGTSAQTLQALGSLQDASARLS